MTKATVGSITVAEPWDKSLENPVRNTTHEYLRFVNTAVFSEEARHFLRHGYYTNAPYGSKDWIDYWDDQEEKCLNGVTIGGVRITGRHHFFLNFSMLKARPIDPITGLERDDKKIITFPRFLDMQYYLFHELEECFAEGPFKGNSLIGEIIAKSRRKGISFVNSGGIISYNYNFVPSSLTTIAAYEAVHYNTLLNGTHFVLNHLNRHTDWAKRRQRVNRRDHFRASFVYQDASGVELEDGFMSEVQAKSFKDDPFKAIGDSTYTMCFEEAGRFKGLLDAYTIAEPTFRDGDIMTGVPLIWGTGGDIEAGGKDLEEMFYNPTAYGLKAYSNIYDENAVGDCGWFIDDLWYMPGETKDRKHVLVDEHGNSYRDLAKVVLMDKRAVRATGSRVAYRKFVTQQPLSPKEAFLRVDSSPFDTMRAQSRLTNILTDQKTYISSIYTARFVIESESGDVKYEYDPDSIPLREFPIKNWDHVDGCPEIYEHPHRNNNDQIQPFRYIAGIDSYDADKATTDSVGSFILLDRLTDRIVCHYKGRPMANKFYETCRRILKYYNATANYERSNKGIYGHFYNMNSIHLLCDEPDILKEKGISKANTIGNNSKGTAPSTAVNAWGRELSAQWSELPAYGEDPDSEIVNMDKIRSIPLLREILSYNDTGNFDDISALGMLMIYRENIATTRVVKETQKKSITMDPFWTRNTPGLQRIMNNNVNKFK